MEKKFRYHVVKMKENVYLVSWEVGGKNIVLTNLVENAKHFMFRNICANAADLVGGKVETIYE